MSKRPETIAIIPARGGSKGIPRKNIADLAGKPLIAYSILAAMHAQYIDRVIVSTEDDEIAEIAKAWGAEVPFLRPKELAEDSSGIGETIKYTLSRLKVNIAERAIVQLYPTSPFRTPTFIDNMMELLYKGYSSIVTVKEVHIDPQFLYILNESDGKFINILKEGKKNSAWKKYYRQYAVFMAYMKQKGGKHYYHVLNEKAMLIDIDYPQDLLCAEAIIREGLFDFEF